MVGWLADCTFRTCRCVGAATGARGYEEAVHARAAVFYSITAAQPGLSGIDLGNLLIKTVAEELSGAHLPALLILTAVHLNDS